MVDGTNIVFSLNFQHIYNLAEDEVNLIYEAADIINQNSCVYVRPRKRSDYNYIEIKVATFYVFFANAIFKKKTKTKMFQMNCKHLQDRNQGCSSYVGFQDQGKQDMSLSPDCFAKIGTIIHEFLHCLGFIHQHSSPERDEYITINWDNIDPSNAYPN